MRERILVSANVLPNPPTYSFSPPGISGRPRSSLRAKLTTFNRSASSMPIWQAILLGFLEGLTEFLPVSSTGHLLLAGHFLGFQSPAKTFEVLIQLGAILAIVFVYFRRLWQML